MQARPRFALPRRYALALLAFILAAPAPTASALSERMDVPEMARQAHWIVEGRVNEVRSEWNPAGTQIYSYVSVGIERLHKGSYPSDTLELRVLGGVVNDVAMTIVGGPKFVEGQRAVIFLGENPQALLPTIGMAQGVFELAADPHTGRETATNSRGLRFTKNALDGRIRDALGTP